MVHEVILFGKRAVPIQNRAGKAGSRNRFNNAMKNMADNLEFRRRWKKVSYIELWTDAAIFKFADGTKWYMNIS